MVQHLKVSSIHTSRNLQDKVAGFVLISSILPPYLSTSLLTM